MRREHKEIAEKLLRSFYVDNCVPSLDTERETHHFIEVSTQLMANAKFELRGWEFTDSNGSTPQPEISKVLGMLWNRKNDILSCEVDLSIEMTEPLTRRKLLSIAQRIFDHIGFCCPVILHPKLLLQESWKAKLSWDDELPKDVTEKFKKWLKLRHQMERF
ncbi:integrase catalytic domain-containing protein [Trichonephila clavipes]|nr:integrase catalytic domain-containing protein [Trichonephila clavipes]